MYGFKGKEVSSELNGEEISIEVVDFTNKMILLIRKNGEVDTTFDVKAPDSQTFFAARSQADPFADFICDKTCLIGQSSNLKISILVNHIAKLIYSNNESRNLIITLSSKLFPKEDSKKDLDIIIEILSTLKKVL